MDLLNRSSTSINWDKPRRVSSLYPDQRWRAYMVMLSREGKSIISRHLVCITVASGIEISVILIPCYDICGYSSTLRGLRVDESFDRSAVWSGNKNVDESFGFFCRVYTNRRNVLDYRMINTKLFKGFSEWFDLNYRLFVFIFFSDTFAVLLLVHSF